MNICENEMKVTGCKNEIDRFLRDNIILKIESYSKDSMKPVLSFDKVLPTPRKEDGSLISSWYSWRCEAWGVPHDTTGTSFMEVKKPNNNEYTLSLYFTTGNSQPHKYFDYIIDEYKNLKFEISWYEPGCSFGGFVKAEFGRIIDVDNVCYNKDKSKYFAFLVEYNYEGLDSFLDQIDQFVEDDEEYNRYSDELTALHDNKDVEGFVKMYIEIIDELGRDEF